MHESQVMNTQVNKFYYKTTSMTHNSVTMRITQFDADDNKKQRIIIPLRVYEYIVTTDANVAVSRPSCWSYEASSGSFK